MSADKVMIFGGKRLYCLTGSDIEAAQDALAAGEVEGLVISRHRGFAQSDLGLLDRFDELRTLVIVDATDVDISAVEAIESLRYLSLGEVVGRLHLGRLKNLEHLRFIAGRHIPLPPEGLPRLQELAIWSFPEKDLSTLSAYAGLRSLEVIQAKKLVSLTGIDACRGLRHLVMAYCPALQDIGGLNDLKELNSLDFESVKKIESYSPISALAALEKLVIEKAAPVADLEFIRPLKALKHVVIRAAAIESCDLSPLTELRQLSHVYLDNKKEYEPVLGQLKKQVDARKAAHGLATPGLCSDAS